MPRGAERLWKHILTNALPRDRMIIVIEQPKVCFRPGKRLEIVDLGRGRRLRCGKWHGRSALA